MATDVRMPVPEQLSPVVEHRLKRENAELRRQLQDAVSKQVLDQDYQQFVAEVAAARRPIPEWMVKPKSAKRHQAMPLAHLSDIHHGEHVNAAEVGYVNGFSSEISRRRVRRFFERTILLCDEYLAGVDYPGITVPVSGDLVTGNIHDELRETNDQRILPTVLDCAEMIAAGLIMLRERFGKVYALSLIHI